MELVYKKDGFITKLFACLFIALFVVMCVVGNSVFAYTYHDNIFDSDIVIPDNVLQERNVIYFIRTNVSGGRYSVYLIQYDKNATCNYKYNSSNSSFPNEFIINGNCMNTSYTEKSKDDCIAFLNSMSSYSLTSTETTIKFSDVVFNDKTAIYSNLDIKDFDGNVVFQGAPQSTVLAGIVEQQEMKPLEEILTLLPIVMIVVVSFLALRKALATLFNFLRTS